MSIYEDFDPSQVPEPFGDRQDPNHTDTSRSGDLVERLRERTCVVFNSPGVHPDTECLEAADRIEALEAENERLKVEVMRQMKWKTEAQNDVDEMAVALDNIANESSDTWAREKARAALAGDRR